MIGFDHATRHFIRTLENYPQTLSHLFNTDTVTIIAISSGTYRYVRIRLVMNIVRCCSSRIPAYPWLGWVGPPLHFHLGLGQVSGGTLSGSSPPQKIKTVRESFPSYGSNHSQMP